MNKNETQFWDLIAGKLHGELDSEESGLFEKEMHDSQNQSLFSKSEKIHTGLIKAKSLQSSDKNRSWQKIESKIRIRRLNTYTKSFLKYAAILLLAFLSGLYFHSVNSTKKQNIQFAEIDVMYGQTSHLTLFDGTEVWLNSGTKFKYPNEFNANERDVYLEGEAFFKVAKNKHLPFKVKTGKLEIEVLGTSFNVSAYKDEPTQSVVLEEGKVQLNNAEGIKIGDMKPGQIAVKTDGQAAIRIQNTDPYFYTSWKDGKVEFNGEKLSDIAKKMERWYNVDIRFEKQNLKDYKFTGTILRNKPIDQTIMALELLAPIRFNYLVRTNEKNSITIVEK